MENWEKYNSDVVSRTGNTITLKFGYGTYGYYKKRIELIKMFDGDIIEYLDGQLEKSMKEQKYEQCYIIEQIKQKYFQNNSEK